MSRLVLCAIFCIVIAGCASTSEVPRPTTNSGLTALSTIEIEQALTGKSFIDVSGSWTWDFQDDGLAQAKASNGEWETKDQKWSVEDGKLCRSIKDSYPCVSIYRVDDVIFFGKADSENLETWAIREL